MFVYRVRVIRPLSDWCRKQLVGFIFSRSLVPCSSSLLNPVFGIAMVNAGATRPDSETGCHRGGTITAKIAANWTKIVGHLHPAPPHFQVKGKKQQREIEDRENYDTKSEQWVDGPRDTVTNIEIWPWTTKERQTKKDQTIQETFEEVQVIRKEQAGAYCVKWTIRLIDRSRN